MEHRDVDHEKGEILQFAKHGQDQWGVYRIWMLLRYYFT